MTTTIRFDITPEIVAAVRVARIESGHRISRKTGAAFGPKTVEYAGPRQHAKIRRDVTTEFGALDMPITAKTLCRYTGMSGAAMRRAARGDTGTAISTEIRSIGRRFGTVLDSGAPDSWARGAFLCAIFYAWLTEIRSNERAANRSVDAPVSDAA